MNDGEFTSVVVIVELHIKKIKTIINQLKKKKKKKRRRIEEERNEVKDTFDSHTLIM